VTVLAGACVALSPLAALAAAILALVAGSVTRALGGNSRFAALVAGSGSFAVLAVIELADPARAAAIAVLLFAAALPRPATRR
jgi:hypothetical protein